MLCPCRRNRTTILLDDREFDEAMDGGAIVWLATTCFSMISILVDESVSSRLQLNIYLEHSSRLTATLSAFK